MDAGTWIDSGDAMDASADAETSSCDAEADLPVDAVTDADADESPQQDSGAGADGPDSAMKMDAPADTDWQDARHSITEGDAGPDSGTDTQSDARALVASDSGSDVGPKFDAPLPTDASAPSDGATLTATATPTATATASHTANATPSATATNTPTGTGTASQTVTATPTTTGTNTLTGTSTASRTATAIPSGTGTGTGSRTATATPTATGTGTPSLTATQTATSTPSSTGTASNTATQSSTSTPSNTGTGTGTRTSTQTTTPSGTGTSTGSGTGSAVSVTGVTLNKTTDQISAGSADQLVATVAPANATNRTVAWSTSNAGVATVSSSGLVTAVAGGTATITVTTADGAKKATCLVTVVVPVTRVLLSLSTASIGLGQSAPLTATLVPANATNQNLTWSSSDTSIATVTATGNAAVVSTISGGYATITVSTQDGNHTAICLVTVAMAAQWVRIPSGGGSYSNFASAAVDTNGNVFVVGAIYGTDAYSFGNSVTASGPFAGSNLLLVKFDPSGAAVWARTVTVAPSASSFNSVAINAAGEIFAAGAITGKGTFGFGDSVVATGAYAFGTNLLLVKYDANGTAKWARTVFDGMLASSYSAVAIDSANYLYAAGAISGGNYDLGNGIGASGVTAGGKTAIVVKYDAGGTAQWAGGTLIGSGESVFNAVSASASGSIYVAGYMTGSSLYGFGNAISATGTGSQNALLVQYTGGGIPRWARTSTSGGNPSTFSAVAATASGSVYAAGSLNGHTANAFGSGVTITGAYASDANAILLKYDASGTTLWGLTPSSASGSSRFAGLAVDQAENVYVAGTLAGPGPYDFGNSMVAQTLSAQNEVLLAQFNPAGLCHSAETAAAGTTSSGFYSLAADSAAHVYACGTINGTGAINFGNTATVTPAFFGGSNGALVRYQ